MYNTFAAEGPTQAELDIAKKQMANTMDETMKDPAFWMGRIDMMTYRGSKLDDTLNIPASYQDMTTDQVKSVFARYYSKPNTVVVHVQPAPDKAAN
jgi:predicted Zn-dependent peptidase